jgi:hypothetical protein
LKTLLLILREGRLSSLLPGAVAQLIEVELAVRYLAEEETRREIRRLPCGLREYHYSAPCGARAPSPRRLRAT